MHTVRTWRGVVGEIRWCPGGPAAAGYTAAGIHGYTVSKPAGGPLTVRATVPLFDAFKLAQRPLTFVASVRLGTPPDQRDAEYVWPIESWTLSDGVFVAVLGLRIKGNHAAMPFRRSDVRAPYRVIG